MTARENLSRFAWLSVAAALATIAIKVLAWAVTGSVGLLSDAAESLVNLVAAIVAVIALKVAAKPADWNHQFGHTKAEYFSAAIEGIMIFLAAASILALGVYRLIVPGQLQELGLGMLISLVAAVINLAVSLVLLRAGKNYRSITLTADGKHLMTDVYTSVGVLIGIGLVWLTGWNWLDPVVAIAVGINILVTGWKLIAQSSAGLMDISLSKEENQRIMQILDRYRSEEIGFHAVRTRVSGARQFMDFHMQVPGEWTVQHGHDAMEDLIEVLVAEFPDLVATGHLEPIEDPRSYEDMYLD